jgi:hypothetical protein
MAQLIAGNQQDGSRLPEHPGILAGDFRLGKACIRIHGYISSAGM